MYHYDIPTTSSPRFSNSVFELYRVFAEIGGCVLSKRLWKHLPKGDGHTVLVVPGFLCGDGYTSILRKCLENINYRAIGWGLGTNSPPTDSLNEVGIVAFRRKVERQLLEIIVQEAEQSNHKVSLIGWSLGGIYSVALAHKHPELINQVITLGTPFGDPRGTIFHNLVPQRMLSKVSDQYASDWISSTFQGDLRVSVTAIYSKSDGFVSPDIALLPEHPMMKNRQLSSSHIGFPLNPFVYEAIAEELSGRQSPTRCLLRRLAGRLS